MYRFTSTSKPENVGLENEKTFLQQKETDNGMGEMRGNEWKEVNQMKITIKKPKNVACGVFLPSKHSGKVYHSEFHSNQREVLLPAGTCFRVIEKKSISNDPTDPKIKMKMECLGQPSKYLSNK